MAHILIITSGLTGIANASLELGSRLQHIGHQVTMSSMRNLSAFYQSYDFTYHQMPEIIEEIDPVLPKHIATSNKLIKKIYRTVNSAKIKEQTYQQFYPRQYLVELEKVNPDLVIIDTELHEFIIPTVSIKKPMLILSQWFQLGEFENLPYLLTDIVPGVGTQGGTRSIRENWAKVRSKRKEIFARKAKATNGTDRRSLVLRLAAELNFPMESIADNYWPGPVTYRGLPMISMTAAELEFPYEVPENYTYVGPMVYRNRKQNIDHSAAERVQIFLDNRSKNNCKLVVCTVSTMVAGDVNFINKVIKAVDGLQDVMLIIGLGGKLQAADAIEHSDRILTLDYVPMLQLLPQADLSINHAGIHTINECIEFGVPMLVYSGKKSDQDGCAARVQYHQLGLIGDKDQEDSSSIATKITEIMNDGQYLENVKAIQTTVEKYKSNASLSQAITKALDN